MATVSFTLSGREAFDEVVQEIYDDVNAEYGTSYGLHSYSAGSQVGSLIRLVRRVPHHDKLRCMRRNVFFELTRELNSNRRIAVLASGQAVVYYRVAILSKDGDWILEETELACTAVLEALAKRGAWYRPGAPLDLRWLRGGWSSHFEYRDDLGRRVRCDFFTRPPRIDPEVIREWFSSPSKPGDLAVVDLESLIHMKQTQRAKDYPAIGELSRKLEPERELELTTDPDRVIELAGLCGQGSSRRAVQLAVQGAPRLEIVLALAEENDRLQQRDRRRLDGYARAADDFLREVGKVERERFCLPSGHARLVELAERLLPTTIPNGRES